MIESAVGIARDVFFSGTWFIGGMIVGSVAACIRMLHYRDDLYEQGIRVGWRKRVKKKKTGAHAKIKN